MANDHSTQTQDRPVHIDDVVSYLSACTDVFGYLESILDTIKKESPESSHVGKLAGAGHMLASDLENLADYWRGEIKNKGVRND